VRSSLRVGIVLDSLNPPAWICRVVESVRDHHHLAFVNVVPPAPAPRLPLLARLLELVDARVFRTARAGIAPCDIRSLVDAIPVTEEAEADVVLAFAPNEAGGAEVWTVVQEGLEAFVRRAPLLRAELRSGEHVIAATSAMPDGISCGRAASNLGARTAVMIEHALERRARRGGAAPRTPAVRAPARVTNLGVLVAGVRAAAGWARYKYRKRYTHKQWGLAFGFGADPRAGAAALHQIVPPPDRLWADPFPIVLDGRAWVFLEELLFEENRGVISVMEVRRDGSWTQPQRVLDLPFHLSYPCVFLHDGALFMVPESEAGQSIDLYRCTDFPLRWERETTLMSGLRAVDTTVFEHDGRWWMYYATDSGDGEGFDRLWLFHADTPRGPWQPHAWNPLECNVSGGRPGGRPFLMEGRLVRATQVGAPYYGFAIELREIVTLTPDRWEERPLQVLRPGRRDGVEATHTINVDRDLVVVDVMRVRRKR
jgi:hypothetical protein